MPAIWPMVQCSSRHHHVIMMSSSGDVEDVAEQRQIAVRGQSQTRLQSQQIL